VGVGRPSCGVAALRSRVSPAAPGPGGDRGSSGRGGALHEDAVSDLDATVSFFTDLGLTLLGTDEVSGEWADTAVGLDGNHARIALLGTPDGHGRIELFEYIHPAAIPTGPTLPHEIGMHRVALKVDDLDAALEVAAGHGCLPLRGVADYQGVYRLTYLRGPDGILVMLAEDLQRQTPADPEE